MLSSWDDYPVHQTHEPVRFAHTSDRNFYDRYYFNMHPSSNELFMVMGLGQYPNLATEDAFAVVRRGDRHKVVRASRELGDRMDTTVGPFTVEVIKPLREVRFKLDETEHPLACDLHWVGSIPAHEEAPQIVRRHGRIMFNTSRFAQTGTWEGWLKVGDERFEVTPDRWWGTRDRSWGVRPHGEKEPAGIQTEGSMKGMWNYSPMQFDGYSILYMLNEWEDGTRELEEATRIDADGTETHLGRPEWSHEMITGTRIIKRSTIHFPNAPGGGFDVEVTPLEVCFVAVGTGYGMDADWRHGMYQGPLVVQGLDLAVEDVAKIGQYGVVDHVARFETSTGDVGYGLHEHAFIGAFSPLGMNDPYAGAV
jgi:hypothetical protein